MTRMFAPLAALAFVLSAAAASSPAFAGDPAGLWLTEDGDAKVRIAACGAAICGTIAWLKDPNDKETGKPKLDKNNANTAQRTRPIIGVPIVLSMKPDGNDKWSGQIYNAEDGKTYSGSLTLASANSIKLQGCVASIFSKTKSWSLTY